MSLRTSLQSPLNLNTLMIGGLRGSTSIVLPVLLFNPVPSYQIIMEENEQTKRTESLAPDAFCT